MDIKKLVTIYEEKCEIKSCQDLLEQVAYSNREIILTDVDENIGLEIALAIRFWNSLDEEREIPITKRTPIKIIIDSGGGSLAGAFTIIDSIKISKTPVHTIVIGAAHSAGLLIAICGSKRYCYPSASYLFHEGSVNGRLSMDANRFNNFTDFYKKQVSFIKNFMFQNTKVTEEWYQKYKNDDFWAFSSDALELGFVDEILTEYK